MYVCVYVWLCENMYVCLLRVYIAGKQRIYDVAIRISHVQFLKRTHKIFSNRGALQFFLY